MKKIFVILLGIIYISFSIYNLIVPAKDFLENENRFSKKMPEFSISSLISGEFTKGYEEYITDKTAFRDFFVSLKSNMEKTIGKKDNNGVYFCDDGYLIQTFDNKDYSDVLSSNINAVNMLAENNDLNVSFSLIPTAYEILKDKLPNFAYNDYQKQVLDYAEDNLKNVNFINSLNTLYDNREEYIYYRTDHHQTMNGSFLVYKDIISSLGYKPYEKKDFDIINMASDFYGTTWSKSTVKTVADSIIKYEPLFDVSYKVSYDLGEEVSSLYSEKNIAIKDKYTYYLDGNHGITTIKTSSGSGEKLIKENGGKIAIIKDSYAHSIIPLIANHYSEITVFDLRYYNLSIPKYLEENNIKDVLFIYNVDNFINDNNLNKISAYLKSM